MGSLDSNILETAAQDLAKFAGSKVIAFDVFYYYDEPDEDRKCHASSYSFGDPLYVAENGLLECFLRDYGTLARVPKSEFSHGELNKCSANTAIGQGTIFRRSDFEWESSLFRQAESKDLVHFLKSENFGGHFLLVRTRHSVSTIDAHLSTFVVFENPISNEKADSAIKQLLWQMLDKFSAIITDELSLNTARHRKEKWLEREQKKTALHIIGHIPPGTTMTLLRMALDNGDLSKAKERWLELRSIDLIRDLAIKSIYTFDAGDKGITWQSNIASYSSLLVAIIKTYSDQTSLYVSIEEVTSKIKADSIASHELNDALTLLCNIWFNAVQSHLRAKTDKPIKIALSIENNNEIIISIKNSGVIDPDSLLMLNNRDLSDKASGRGIRDIVHSLNKLPHVTLKATTNSNCTTMVIQLKSP